MDDPFRDPLVIEMEYLFAEMKVFQDCRASGANFQRVLVVRHRSALSGREDRNVASCDLVQLAAVPPNQVLIMDRCRLVRGPA